MKPDLIILEGIEGSGKTQTAEALKTLIQEFYKKTVFITHEPSGTNIGSTIAQISSLFRKHSVEEKEWIAKGYLIAMQENLKDNILPAINNDEIVICDRSFISTFVHQGFDNYSAIHNYVIKHIEKYNIRFFLLDIQPEKALDRIQTRKQEKDIVRNTKLSDLAYQRNKYLEYFARKNTFLHFPFAMIEINDEKPHEIAEKIYKKL